MKVAGSRKAGLPHTTGESRWPEVLPCTGRLTTLIQLLSILPSVESIDEGDAPVSRPRAPGRIYRFEIDMSATAQTFKAGHCIRVQVTSSDFPRFEPNLNTAGRQAAWVHGQVAHNTVFHDALRPSQVRLPVMVKPA